MLKRILFCTDLSQASYGLLSRIKEFKKLNIQEVVLVHILDFAGLRTNLMGMGAEGIPIHNIKNIEDEISKEAEKNLNMQKDILVQEGFDVVMEMIEGYTIQEISRLAEKHGCSMIYMGTHGKGIIKRTLLGGVSFEVLNNSSRPVFMHRVTVDEDNTVVVCDQFFSNILFLTDFSATSDKAFQYLEEVVKHTKAPVTLLHVHVKSLLSLKFITEDQEIREKNYRRLEEYKVKLEEAGSSRVEIDIAIGDPGRAIIDRIKLKKPGDSTKAIYSEKPLRDQEYSLVIMGSQGIGLTQELFLGSVSYKVALHSAVPVLFVPGEI